MICLVMRSLRQVMFNVDDLHIPSDEIRKERLTGMVSFEEYLEHRDVRHHARDKESCKVRMGQK